MEDAKDEDSAGDDVVLIFDELNEGCERPKDLRCDMGVVIFVHHASKSCLFDSGATGWPGE